MRVLEKIKHARAGSVAATASMARPDGMFPENLRFGINCGWSNIATYVKWLDENLNEDWKIVWDKNYFTEVKHIWFTCEEDALMFKLKFGLDL